jgi:predicted GNAT family acetyltransferase
MNHVLDNPVWHALTGRQAALSTGMATARRYLPDISPWAAAADDSPAGLDALAPLIPENGYVILVRKSERPFETQLVAPAMTFEGFQMAAQNIEAPPDRADCADLGDADAADMLELANLTKPGPFSARTHVLGGFIGIRHEGRLIAMAGERFKLGGYTEVSGVCTHPDFRGKGYAGLLSRIVAARILARGEVPILHVFVTNTAAIRLYEQLGFTIRERLRGAAIRRV